MLLDGALGSETLGPQHQLCARGHCEPGFVPRGSGHWLVLGLLAGSLVLSELGLCLPVEAEKARSQTGAWAQGTMFWLKVRGSQRPGGFREQPAGGFAGGVEITERWHV